MTNRNKCSIIIERTTHGSLVKRLRHGPLKAETWVRFPYESPKKDRHSVVNAYLFLPTRREPNHAARGVGSHTATAVYCQIGKLKPRHAQPMRQAEKPKPDRQIPVRVTNKNLIRSRIRFSFFSTHTRNLTRRQSRWVRIPPVGVYCKIGLSGYATHKQSASQKAETRSANSRIKAGHCPAFSL